MCNKRKCAVCGKKITSGYVWDDMDYFCSEECCVKALNNDRGCFEILVDDGRMVYYDQFPEVCHYRANVNHHHTDCFHHFDNEARMFAWISERIGEDVHSFEDCDAWTKRQATSPAHSKGYIEILFFNPKEFYEIRRAYVLKLRECEDIMTKAQRTRNDKKLTIHSLMMMRITIGAQTQKYGRERFNYLLLHNG